MKLVTAAEMRRIESEAVARGTDLAHVMERAGTQVARVVNNVRRSGDVLVLAGPGNNGGDGLVAARVMEAAGRRVSVYTYGRRDTPSSGSTTRADDDPDRAVLRVLVARAGVVVDALLGTGQTRPVTGDLAEIVTVANERASSCCVVAVDVPTGVDASTGAVLGTAVAADVTVCIGLPKLGVFVGEGRRLAGRVVVVDVGIPSVLASPDAPTVLDVTAAANLFPPRPLDANKGSFGHLLVVAGSRSYLGAPALVASAALRAGTGLVELAATDDVRLSVAALVPEVTYRPVPDEAGTIAISARVPIADALRRADALAIGPGLGRGHGIESVVVTSLDRAHDTRTVIDADALNALAEVPSWWEHLPRESVITPHPGEMARLTGETVETIQRDRIGAAACYAQRWSTVVVLKGSATVVASPVGAVSLNPTGEANLATAGTGDVLTGTIGALLAQGLAPRDAAVLGAYWHGTAGDLAARATGLSGTLAGDLPRLLPRARELTLIQGGVS